MSFYIRCAAVCLASFGVLLLGPGFSAAGQPEGGANVVEATASSPVASLSQPQRAIR
ncbi:hypothetical protein ACFONG_19915 [Uliginosibacterium paludis]|uniref:Uncharacterized protein n=1 Tax=Uliginosibacterium paludis TaxID=1615952 RepID=A0ABV2CWC2_9RHOO